MRPSKRKTGFSLVEIGIALFVIVVGITAILGLIPSGLDTQKRTMDETFVALFANATLNGIFASANEQPWSSIASTRILPPLGADLWDDKAEDLAVRPNAGMRTNFYAFEDATMQIVDFALRYDLDVVEHTELDDVMSIRLEVWPGAYGPTNRSNVFYTEFYRAN